MSDGFRKWVREVMEASSPDDWHFARRRRGMVRGAYMETQIPIGRLDCGCPLGAMMSRSNISPWMVDPFSNPEMEVQTVRIYASRKAIHLRCGRTLGTTE